MGRRVGRPGAWVSASAAAGMALLLPAALARAQAPAPTMHGVTAPLEFYDDGKPKTVLTAGKVKIPVEGEVIAEKVRVEMRRPDGSVETSVTTDLAVYSQKSQIVRTDSRVTVERPELRISGVGFEWSAQSQALVLKSKVRVLLRHSGGGAGSGPGLLGAIGGLRRARLQGARSGGDRAPGEGDSR
jgi:hypothetical protein